MFRRRLVGLLACALLAMGGLATANAGTARAGTVGVLVSPSPWSGSIGAVLNDTGYWTDQTTGSVLFNLYGPNDPTCSKAPIYTQIVAWSNGTVTTSPGYTTSAAGTYLWTSSFSDANGQYPPVQCGDQPGLGVVPVVISELSTTLSEPSGSVGNSVHDSATLGGVTSDAGGSVAYNVYTDGQCTSGAQGAGTVPVTNGVVPDSDAITFTTAGTWYWQAVYSGDANNPGDKSSCDQVIITGPAPTPTPSPTPTSTPTSTPTPTPTPTPSTSGTFVISGTVRASDGQPMAGVEVDLFTEPPTDQPGAITDQNGLFSMTAAAGDYQVHLGQIPSGLYGCYQQGAGGNFTTGYNCTTVTVGPSQTGIDITIPQAHHLSGTVTNEDGTPLAGIYVVAYVGDDDEISATGTDQFGNYSLAVISTTYGVRFSENGQTYNWGCWNPDYSGNFAVDESDCGQVTVGTGNVAGIDVAMTRQLHISGRVVGPDGAGLANFRVLASSANGLGDNELTDADGNYVLSVPPGTYSVDCNSCFAYSGCYVEGAPGNLSTSRTASCYRPLSSPPM